MVVLPGITADYNEPYMRDLAIALAKKDFQVAIYADRRAGPRSLIAVDQHLDVYKDFELTM